MLTSAARGMAAIPALRLLAGTSRRQQNRSCVPSKALLRNAEIASIITHQSATFGISGDVSLDYSRAERPPLPR